MVAANYFCKQWKCLMPQPKTNGAGKLEVGLGGKEEERDIQRGIYLQKTQFFDNNLLLFAGQGRDTQKMIF